MRWISLLLVTAVLSGCRASDPQSRPAGRVLAFVEDIPITAPDVEEMQRIIAWEAADSLAPRIAWPEPPTRPAGSTNFGEGDDAPIVQRLIDQILVTKAAARRNLSPSDNELESAMARFAAFSGRPPGTLTLESEARRLLRRELIAARYWKETVTDLVRVSDFDMKLYLVDHPDAAPGPVDQENYPRLRPYVEPILLKLEGEAAVAAKMEKLRRKARIVPQD